MGSIKKGFAGAMAAFLISAVSPLLIPFAVDSDGKLDTAGYAAGVMFWAGLVIGSIVYLSVSRKLKSEIREKPDGKKRLPSALCFFSNSPAAIMDIVLIVGLAGSVYITVNVIVNEVVAAGCLLLALAGIYGHFLFNGKVYQYIWNRRPEYKKEQLKEGKE